MKLVRALVPAAMLSVSACDDGSTAMPPCDVERVAETGTTEDATVVEDVAGSAADVTTGDAAEPPSQCPEATGERPRARAEHAGVVDPVRRQLVTFGGSFGVPQNCSSIVSHTYESDTWIFDLGCSQWRSVSGTAPAGRTRHGAVHDSRGDRMLIYGGRSRAGASGPYTLYGDVHAFDLKTETWSELATTGAPPPRFNAATAYDSVNHRLLVFGGNTSSSGLVYTETNEVWALDLGSLAWTRLVATGDAPSPRFWVNGAFDAVRNWFVIYGGSNGNQAFSDTAVYEDDLWVLDLSQSPPDWYLLGKSSPDQPEGRFWAGVAVDAERDRYLVFGGHDDKNLGNRNDLWALNVNGETWEVIRTGDTYNSPPTGFCQFPADFANIDDASPERRHAHVFAAGAGLAVTTGGKTDCGNVDDIFALELATDTWQELLTATVGEACIRKGGTTCNDMCF